MRSHQIFKQGWHHAQLKTLPKKKKKDKQMYSFSHYSSSYVKQVRGQGELFVMTGLCIPVRIPQR